MTDTMREKFEAIGRSYGNDLSRLDDTYLNDDTSAAWMGFQAGYQAAQAEARALVGEMIGAVVISSNQLLDQANPMEREKVWDLCQEALTKAQAFMEGK